MLRPVGRLSKLLFPGIPKIFKVVCVAWCRTAPTVVTYPICLREPFFPSWPISFCPVDASHWLDAWLTVPNTKAPAPKREMKKELDLFGQQKDSTGQPTHQHQGVQSGQWSAGPTPGRCRWQFCTSIALIQLSISEPQPVSIVSIGASENHRAIQRANSSESETLRSYTLSSYVPAHSTRWFHQHHDQPKYLCGKYVVHTSFTFGVCLLFFSAFLAPLSFPTCSQVTADLLFLCLSDATFLLGFGV